ncbi:hypothetical protein IW152_002558 [Coemansia sp. BCRC 34962]|nr:hypothetical protein IW152_002558 [Coemansia sp. BCRC 34962]
MNFYITLSAFYLLFRLCLAFGQPVFSFRQAAAVGAVSFAAGWSASQFGLNYDLGGWYADAKHAIRAYYATYAPSSPLQSPQVAAPVTDLQFSRRTDLIVTPSIHGPQPEPVNEGNDFWFKFSEELSPLALRITICVVLLKKTGVWKFVRLAMPEPELQPDAHQPDETEALPHVDTVARVAFVAVNAANSGALLRSSSSSSSTDSGAPLPCDNAICRGAPLIRQIVVSPEVLLLREIVVSSSELAICEIVVGPDSLLMLGMIVSPGALLIHETIVNPAVLLQHVILVSPGALLLHGNAICPGMLHHYDNVVSPSAPLPRDIGINPGTLLLRGDATSSAVLLCNNAACLGVARQCNKAISVVMLPHQHNIIASPGAPLLRNLAVCPSLLPQHYTATGSRALQLPNAASDSEEPQSIDIAHTVTAVASPILRLAPSLAAGPDMPTRPRPRAPSAPSDYTANRGSIIVLSPVRRRADSARSIPMSRLMNFTSNTIPRRRLSRRATVGTTPALRRQNTLASLPPHMGVNSAPSSPAQVLLSIANKQVPIAQPLVSVSSLGDGLTAAAEAVSPCPGLATIAEEGSGMAALINTCDEAFGSTGAINTDFGPFKQASSSSLVPASTGPLDQQEPNDKHIARGLRSRWLNDESSLQTLTRYSERKLSTAFSTYLYASSASNSMQSLWQEVGLDTERTSTLTEHTVFNQKPSTSSLADTASAVSPRRRDILKAKLLGNSPSTFSLRSALRPSSSQVSDLDIERVPTSSKPSLSRALKSLTRRASGKLGLGSSSTTTQTPTPSEVVSTQPDPAAPQPTERSSATGPSALRRAPSLSITTFMRRPRSAVSAPSVDQAAKRASSGYKDKGGQA